VRSSCGVEVTPWDSFGEPDAFDYLVVVGGLIRGHERIDGKILDYLRRVDQQGKSLIGVCTGSFALARAGLMKGYRCCVHWHHLHEFVKEFPGHHVDGDSVYVVDGRRITCPGGQSAIDVALCLIERHCGRSMALKVASGMVLEAARSARHPQPHPEAEWFREIDSSLVQHAILLMEQQSTARKVMARDIAAKLGVSVRTLVRGFNHCLGMSPAAFLRALRMAHGRWDVLNTDKPVGWIAAEYGFSDASHFTRLFRQYYGVTPAVARENGDVKKPLRRSKGAAAQPQSKRALDRILWQDPLSFASIDWPSDARGRDR